MILLVSVLTAPFAWVYDEVILLVPVMQVVASVANRDRAASVSRGVVIAYVAINAAIFIMNRSQIDPFWYVWTPFAFLACYAGARAVSAGHHITRVRPSSSSAPL